MRFKSAFCGGTPQKLYFVNDISVLLDAKRAGAILVTRDREYILKNAKRLQSAIGVRVISAKQAVAEVRKQMRRRDAIAKNVVRLRGCSLPDWVEKDECAACCYGIYGFTSVGSYR